MFARRLVSTLGAAVLLGVLATVPTGAFPLPNRTTYFTFSGPVQLPGVTLARGTYIFEVANPNGRADVVRVLSSDRSTVYFMQFTNLVYRPRTSNLKSSITLGEAPAGTVPPVKAWYPESETLGREFIFR
jgi:hypothetical protein